MPATSPAPRASRTAVPRRPDPATVATMPAVARSRTIDETVPDASPVSLTRSAWLTDAPDWSRSSARTRRRLATRNAVAEPGEDMRQGCAHDLLVVKVHAQQRF